MSFYIQEVVRLRVSQSSQVDVTGHWPVTFGSANVTLPWSKLGHLKIKQDTQGVKRHPVLLKWW